MLQMNWRYTLIIIRSRRINSERLSDRCHLGRLRLISICCSQWHQMTLIWAWTSQPSCWSSRRLTRRNHHLNSLSKLSSQAARSSLRLVPKGNVTPSRASTSTVGSWKRSSRNRLRLSSKKLRTKTSKFKSRAKNPSKLTSGTCGRNSSTRSSKQRWSTKSQSLQQRWGPSLTSSSPWTRIWSCKIRSSTCRTSTKNSKRTSLWSYMLSCNNSARRKKRLNTDWNKKKSRFANTRLKLIGSLVHAPLTRSHAVKPTKNGGRNRSMSCRWSLLSAIRRLSLCKIVYLKLKKSCLILDLRRKHLTCSMLACRNGSLTWRTTSFKLPSFLPSWRISTKQRLTRSATTQRN